MPDRDHVIATMEYCLEHGSMGGRDCWVHCDEKGNITNSNARDECPNGNCKTGCMVTPIREAIELLKEQEPRVMTLDEIKAWDGAMLVEYPGTFGQSMSEWVMYIETERQYVAFANVRRSAVLFTASEYGISWRCWTTRPTDEQRKVKPWP